MTSEGTSSLDSRPAGSNPPVPPVYAADALDVRRVNDG